jgi:hypothetical protein
MTRNGAAEGVVYIVVTSSEHAEGHEAIHETEIPDAGITWTLETLEDIGL